ncbi:MAG: helix-hairpin-helix domain-containing protein [Deltaproteobacteria bacterium]|nr:helix-hairpin-helix domain-containing protein [Deltaproteobacteria bacterium]
MNRESDGLKDKRYAAFLLLAGILLSVFFITAEYAAISQLFMPAVSAKEAAASRPGAAAAPVAAFPGFPIDINTASREDLMMLPGVGEKTAVRILEERARGGGFKNSDGLLNVKYISGAKLDALRAFVTVKSKG